LSNWFVSTLKCISVITACCGGGAGSCQTYSTADNLTGIACCDLTPFNSITHLCCDGNYRKRSDPSMYVDKCCGKNLLVPNQTCCNGTVHNVVNGDCCGTAVYSASESTYLCCEGNLSRTISPTDKCCGPMAFDGGVQEICCGGKVRGDAVGLKQNKLKIKISAGFLYIASPDESKGRNGSTRKGNVEHDSNKLGESVSRMKTCGGPATNND
uniref:Galaxin-like n=1 Tax=Haemonchus placei TaxID=6290 RepID=A0A0N4VW88_HAEPC